MSFIESCGKNIFYETFKGKGDTDVIYVAGHKEIPYEKYKAPVLKKFCVNANIPFTWFDYMGYGKSEGDKSLWQLTEWLQNLLDIMEKSKYNRHILIGTSMGGYLMMAAALLKPDKVRGLFGLAPGFGKSFQTLSSVPFIADKDGLIKIDILNKDGFNYISQPLNINCPIQLVYSYDDESVNIKSADYIRESIKNAVIMKVKGVNHSMENEDVLKLAEAFIKVILAKD